MLAWRASLPALKYLLPLKRLVRLMALRSAGEPRQRSREGRVITLADRVFDGGQSDRACLERSLVTYRYLGAAGARPRLVIAVGEAGGRARGHAWVTVDGVPVHDSASLLENFASVIMFEAGGHIDRSEVSSDAGG
jgi:transglutaminase superfamily protein